MFTDFRVDGYALIPAGRGVVRRSQCSCRIPLNSIEIDLPIIHYG